jgi:hypothetical protein
MPLLPPSVCPPNVSTHAQGVTDSHPKVRWASCQALGQLCTDLGPDLQASWEVGWSGVECGVVHGWFGWCGEVCGPVGCAWW